MKMCKIFYLAAKCKLKPIWDMISYLLKCLILKGQQIPNIKMWIKWDYHILLVRLEHSTVTLEKVLTITCKVKWCLSYDPAVLVIYSGQ